MNRKLTLAIFLLAAAMLLSGCVMRTVDQMYSLPKRSAEHQDLQKAIDGAMTGLEYCAPLSGENQQTVQMADLDGDGEDEYLLFARGTDEKPMQILIFGRENGEYVLKEAIESQGSAFEQIEYVQLDDRPGAELVVGRQVSGQVLKSLSVYTFAAGEAEQLMAVNYYRFVTSDLNSDGRLELMLIFPGATDADPAVAALYAFGDGIVNRSNEVDLSGAADRIKRIMVGKLHGGMPAVYVASSVDESAIITDVLALKSGIFTNVSFSNESGTSVQTLRNYYVYADDIDSDGILELPSLMTMVPLGARSSTAMQYLIRWYAMELDGGEVDKMYTFHNFDSGWYIRLDSTLAPEMTVEHDGNSYAFYVWDEEYREYQKLFTVYALTGSNREEAAVEDNRFVLHRAEATVYAARLEATAGFYEITQESLTESFKLIHQDWYTGET